MWRRDYAAIGASRVELRQREDLEAVPGTPKMSNCAASDTFARHSGPAVGQIFTMRLAKIDHRSM